jgi:4-coumarate--CoA ligase
LRTMPGVADVAVIGIPHERSGEAPRAYVVKREGSSDLDEAQVAQFVAINAAPYKHLVGGVEFVDVIPKSNSGKILRKELKATYKT